MNEHEQSQDGAAFQSEATKDLTAELTAIQQQKTEHEAVERPMTPHDRLRGLVSEEAKRKLADEVARGLEDPQIQEVLRLQKTKDGLMDRYDAGEITYAEVDAESERIRNELYGPLRGATIRSGELEAQRDALAKGRVELYGETANVETKEIIASASNKDAINAAHTFVDPDSLRRYERAAYDVGQTLIVKTSDTVDVPLGMFVSADGFESWYGRREGVLKDGRPSNEVIDDYAERTTAPPPVDLLTGYALPDGRIYFKTENAHRVAAAIKRGDSHIQVKGRIRLYVLDESPAEL